MEDLKRWTLTSRFTALVIYDYLLTLTKEYQTIWRRKPSLASLVLLVNRYALVTIAASLIAVALPVYDDALTSQVSLMLISHRSEAHPMPEVFAFQRER